MTGLTSYPKREKKLMEAFFVEHVAVDAHEEEGLTVSSTLGVRSRFVGSSCSHGVFQVAQRRFHVVCCAYHRA